ncbi:antitoxin [Nonomuraea sp. NPDC050478]|uniref:antitoxin n=1 Tax=Nonomuraea sp. NPDC050478 TaxID=3364365 RepID=UPI00379C55D3
MMSGMGDWAKKAEDLAKKNPDKADEILERGEQAASEKTGGKYDEQIGKSVDAAQRRYGGGKGEGEDQSDQQQG